MPVGELLDRMSSKEFAEWMAYDDLEPFGPERADLRAGIIASVVANANRDPKKRPAPFKPADFMPFREQEPPTPEDLRAKFMGLTSEHRGNDR